MLKLLKRLKCKHKHVERVRTDLVKDNKGHYWTKHVWKCKDCGKRIK